MSVASSRPLRSRMSGRCTVVEMSWRPPAPAPRRRSRGSPASPQWRGSSAQRRGRPGDSGNGSSPEWPVRRAKPRCSYEDRGSSLGLFLGRRNRDGRRNHGRGGLSHRLGFDRNGLDRGCLGGDRQVVIEIGGSCGSRRNPRHGHGFDLGRRARWRRQRIVSSLDAGALEVVVGDGVEGDELLRPRGASFRSFSARRSMRSGRLSRLHSARSTATASRSVSMSLRKPPMSSSSARASYFPS